ncbi:putative membrane protein YphA (DoxX/SURF4 family) [Hymenobacter luteus]|uniref:Membrane protein YphA (DoxX/SURF4 family) n=2 Tax=Hymenobacter TaxID=89966 RepID=A0ABR6K225_9BACT|nr:MULTISPECIES: DoxX family protein [Hymenobacter]MBB4602609.1 putative membrane protein YphA (DoxX/SURF4 family) [Hymenobacter latericoloratus]MBB6060500.1 putative membrane protein YphA (DoxX/SURF4 family) [Hymenobacter luteus]
MELSNQFPVAQRRRRTSATNPIWMDALRIMLGLFLFIKGVSFLDNSTDVFALLRQQPSLAELRKASLFVSTFHIVGGLMIAFGALTRFALLLQIPILAGAVLLVNFRNGLRPENTELWVSALVLLLCLFFLIAGPGRYSIDNKVFRHQPPRL